MNPQDVTDLLKSKGYLTAEQATEMQNEALQSANHDVFDVVAEYNIMERDQVLAVIAEDIGAQMVDISAFEPAPEILALVPAGMARLHGALPVTLEGDAVVVVLTDPLNAQTTEDLRFALGREVTVMIGDPKRAAELIEQCYAGGGDDSSQMIADMIKDLENFDVDAEADDDDPSAAPIVRYVDLVLYQAMKEQASDIHFEPFEDDFKIRYRVDGALYEMAPPPLHLSSTIISRVKVMSNLNIAEKRLPQDGRIQKTIDNKEIDFRVSTLPTVHGESVVLRVLDRSSVSLDLENLGLQPDLFNYIGETVEKPNGIFIVTGPTGAGKTTTLYACLRRINTVDTKLLTAEDPVEYDIDGIIQVPVNEGIGVTFARILRAFLRQDPDKIMVGEMRDLETAQIAIQASLTGHLVFSTLHTNDAPGAVTRLVDMGTEPFLVSATLEAILGQRLLRTICKDCRTPYEPSEAILGQLGLSVHDIGDKQFHTGVGCDTCGGSGYKGRQGLFELLDMSEPIRELVAERAPTVVLREKAIELGMVTLRDDGLRNIYSGGTTIEEVLKYT
ncbi:MAG: type IV pilus assembly protein PilB [Pseudoalteromonas tetraodonis]|jgi:type IV pilus assembly protein PilB